MTDIVERLRACQSRDFWPPEADRICAEAADEIERLRADKDVQRSQERNTSYEASISELEADIERLKDEAAINETVIHGLRANRDDAEAEVERLKELLWQEAGNQVDIERLRDESETWRSNCERLLAALKEIEEHAGADSMIAIARKALEGK